MLSQPFLVYGRQSIDQIDIDHVIEALQSDFLTTGPWVERFERELAAYVGAKEAVVVANGTAALHLAMLALGVGSSDVIIVPSITFVASANCAAFCGARVVFADVDPLTGLMTDETFEEALKIVQRDYSELRFRGVVPVHYAGRPVTLDQIAGRCAELDAFVVEDACHALGTVDKGVMTGACEYSQMALFSFHPVKTLTTGEGGAIMTNDPELARKLRSLRSHGLERDPTRFTGLGFGDDRDSGGWVYEMQALGYNYRLPDLNCALGVSQLNKMPHFAARRRRLVELYQAALASARLPVSWTAPAPESDPVFHLMAVQIDFRSLGKTRTEVMAQLKARGVGTQVHYIPVHRQPYWQQHALGQRDLPRADAYYSQTLSLPLYPDMTDADPAAVIAILKEVCGL
ncbi:UDP-4-amino-4,6-dideoxy-N-acetyl-beta-L-altrosamine transaminase [Asticcacaulis sp. SL142]|uniref:UDP-4-amino-4, 6-dideoxy-N-acetyl-beta-L-altrosamine transaminase n=1 Tax=Asticcacaulis sp. SL142 TaxID=2995155 RepID=UPI00226CBB0D|nr:UDP-4-amino-4,6-dideoxy-N-acetyl-beta-L-altrosamine transaminase [Asticcacaulis sp. SL142]WAC47477.1 UDP-4-amino-4,6-dideoxy-N-acetyl-beta-L-altrosamine transaminase [Asticcacaulis sp. SL142]